MQPFNVNFFSVTGWGIGLDYLILSGLPWKGTKVFLVKDCLFGDSNIPFNITVIQVYIPTSNAEAAEAEWLYEDLQDLLELTPKKDVLFIIGDWNANVGSQEIPAGT